MRRPRLAVSLAALVIAAAPTLAHASDGSFGFGSALPLAASSSTGSSAATGTAAGSIAKATTTSAASRANGYPMALKYIIKEGVKPVYLGAQGGVDAYLGVSPTGRIQTFYVWPDGVHVVAGVMFNAQGHNVSMHQLSAMKKRFMEAAEGAQVDQPAGAGYSTIVMHGKDPDAIPVMHHIASQPGVRLLYLGGDGGTPSYAVTNSHGGMDFFYPTPDGRDVVVGMMFGHDGRNITAAQVTEHQVEFRSFLKDTAPAPSSESDSTSPAKASAPAVAAGGANGANVSVAGDSPASANAQAVEPPATTASPISANSPDVQQVSKAKFDATIPYTASFPVGNPNAPVVWMFADPQCPYCHADWQELKPLVLANKINVHVVLVDRVPSSARYNISIMSQANPGIAWLRGWGSTANLGNIPPPPSNKSAKYRQAETWLSDNMAAVRKLRITATPFFAYTTKGGVFHAEQGPPSVRSFVEPLLQH